MCSSARPKAKARSRSASSLPKGWDRGDHRPRAGAGAAGAAARGRHASGDRQADHRRHRPLRAVRPARRHLRQSRSVEEVFSVGLNRAVSLLAEKKAGGGRRGRGDAGGAEGARRASDRGRRDHGARRPLRPYVNHGKVNATLPKGKDPASVTLETGGGADRRQGRKGPGGRSGAAGEGGRKTKPAKAEAEADAGLTVAKKRARAKKRRRGRCPPATRSSPSSPSIPARRESARSPAPSASRAATGSRSRRSCATSPTTASCEAPRQRLKRPGDLPPVTVLDDHRPRPRRRAPRRAGRVAARKAARRR